MNYEGRSKEQISKQQTSNFDFVLLKFEVDLHPSSFILHNLFRSRLTDHDCQRDDDAADRRRHLLGEKHRGVNWQRDHDQPD